MEPENFTLYIIGRKAPEGATSESEITHYYIAKDLEEAKKGIGQMVTRDDFVKLIADKPYIKLKAYNPLNGSTWDLELTQQGA